MSDLLICPDMLRDDNFIRLYGYNRIRAADTGQPVQLTVICPCINFSGARALHIRGMAYISDLADYPPG